jgi:hypothetical protein
LRRWFIHRNAVGPDLKFLHQADAREIEEGDAPRFSLHFLGYLCGTRRNARARYWRYMNEAGMRPHTVNAEIKKAADVACAGKRWLTLFNGRRRQV